jgi:DNA-binding SARP family transcriptional activator/tetratricopeptide (TPR) repeat protein
VTVHVRVLGGFEVTVDGVPVAPEAWGRRQASSLVKLLAVAPGHRLHREQVIDALWPGTSVATAGPRLHKAAHYARRALRQDGVLVLRNETVALGPDVTVDADDFERSAREALADGTAVLAGAALDAHAGPLLPDDRYSPWAEAPRETVAALHRDLLRLTGRWEELLAEDPADEEAHLALARDRADRGDVRGALRQLERLDRALRRELGTAPGPAAEQLRSRLESAAGGREGARDAAGGARSRLVGRRSVGDRIREALDRARSGHGSTLVVTGPPGVGKTAVLRLALGLAGQRGWRTGRGSASAVEGPWPYAPVLEALSDLSRRHPALLDGLDDVYRQELERALVGRDVAWTGESGHQRLFVAAAELVRLAAAGHGLMLVVDDVHEADRASLRLLHYLSRCAVTEPVLVVLAHRALDDAWAREIADSLVARGAGARIDLAPLTESATRRLVAEHHPGLPAQTVDRIWAVSGGLPFTALELARAEDDGGGPVLPPLPAPVLNTLERLALLGATFATDELLAVAGVPEDDAYRHLETALTGLVVEPADSGYRFRHALVRQALLDRMSPPAAAAARREVAERLEALDVPSGRLAHHFLAAGLPSRAVPHVVRAVETAGALGAYRDALELVDRVRDHAGPEHLPRLLARRGDLLLALGDPDAVPAFQEAVALTDGTEQRLVRARLARAAAFAGDLDTARMALAGLEPAGDQADGAILMAKGNLAYFSGDIDAAWDVTALAREQLSRAGDSWQLVDLISLQGLIAHQRGEWFERFRLELRRTQGKQRMTTALFDAHLCVAEYMLYGPVPYPEVIAETEELRTRATRAGALRGVAFATALIGEAALLMGDLDRAERELLDAVDLHRDVDASAGEAHSLQRLAEVRLARGDRAGAAELLDRALPLGRFSVIALHLVQRVYGSMIQAAPDPVTARAVVDRAEATLGENDRCPFCDIMLAVPATIACARVGDLAEARRHLATAEDSAARWEGTAWTAATLEARAHVIAAEGDGRKAADLSTRAALLFRQAGQPLDAARCELAATGVSRDPAPA